jgi:hypothetical protein
MSKRCAKTSVPDRYDHHSYDDEARAALERWNEQIDEWTGGVQ